MTLKQVDENTRIKFLRKFTEELVMNSVREIEIRRRIDGEKLRQKFVSPNMPPDEAVEKVALSPVFQPSSFQIKNMHRPIKRVPISKRLQLRRRFWKKNASSGAVQIKQEPRIKIINELKPQYQQPPQGFNLGKLDNFFKDPLIQSIECSGPGRNILVKKYNKINPTGLVLTQSEISQLINGFSKQAKIPIVGGILKAAVGNLVISAVSSGFVGSRFIISRLNPQRNIANEITK